jgi:hypothetical protein
VVDVSALSEAKTAEVFAAAQEVVKRAGGDGDYDLFLDEPARDVDEEFGAADEILVKRADGTVSAFAENSPLVDALNRQLAFRRIHVAEEYRDEVRLKVEGFR